MDSEVEKKKKVDKNILLPLHGLPERQNRFVTYGTRWSLVNVTLMRQLPKCD